MTDFKKLKVVELRAELSARGLPQTGKRDELIERLEEHEFQNAEPSHDDEMQSDMMQDDEKFEVVDTKLEYDKAQMPAANSQVQEILPEISPVIPPSEPETAKPDSSFEQQRAMEEEKRRLRALRFGIDEAEAATQVKIEVAIKRLDHALPNRSRQHHRGSIKKHSHSQHRQISINKP